MATLGFWLCLLSLRLDGQILGPSLLAVSAEGVVRQVDFDQAELPADTDHVWLWAYGRAPLRARPGDLKLAKNWLRDQPRHPVWLALRRQGKRGGSEHSQSDGFLLAAPAEMWLEVPEHLLPRLTVSSQSEVAIVAASRAIWRFRFVGQDCGSFWQDAEVGPSFGTQQVVVGVWPAEDYQIEVLRTDGSYVDEAVIELGPRYNSQQMSSKWALYTAGPQGLAGVPALPGLEPLTLGVHSPGLVSAWTTGNWSAMARRFVLEEGGTIVGRVLSDGVPVKAPATVEAEWWAGGGRTSVESIRKETREGLFSLEGVPPGQLALEIRLDGYAGASLQLKMEARGRIDVGDVELKSGADLKVRVLRQDSGEPIPAAFVSCSRGREAKPVEASTDAQGEARCQGLAAGESVSVRVYRSGFLRGEAEGVYPGAGSTVEVRLRAAFVAHGRFLDAEDRVPINPTCRLEQGRRKATCAVEANGAFQVEPEPGKAFAIFLSSVTTAPLELPQKAGREGEDRDLGILRAPPGATIVGRVQDESGQPLPGARVWAIRAEAGGLAIALQEGDRAETQSDAQGNFVLSGLTDRQLDLLIQAPGLARGRFPIAIPEGENRWDVGDLELSTGATIEVLLDRNPETSASAVLDLYGSGQRADRMEAGVDAARAIFENVPEGRHRLRVYDPQLLCQREIEVEGERKVRVDCEGARRTVRGRATRGGGRVAAKGTLYFNLPAGKTVVVILNSGTPSGLRKQDLAGAEVLKPIQVALGKDGEFETDQLAAGNWIVSWISEDGSRTSPREILVPDGDEATLLLDFGGFLVRGEVLDAEGNPAAGARVEDDRFRLIALSGVDGTFRWESEDIAPLNLRASRGSLASDFQKVTPTADGAVVVIRLPAPEPPADPARGAGEN